MSSEQYEWSEWLDFDKTHVDSAPESAGVYLIHASMKVLRIGGGDSIRRSLQELLVDPCASKAKRFHYLLTESPEATVKQLLDEYKEKHQGKLPSCMDNQQI